MKVLICLRWASLALAAVCMLSAAAAASVVINEVCYDPPGPDAGREFVELINTGIEAVELAGYTLEFGNGSVGPVWAVRWTGVEGDRLEPGRLFLVVDRGWTGPAADAEVSLGLQNGPDALRLVRADGSVDMVGWGDLAWPEMYEGRPHPGAAGLSLARRPDGHDTDDNAADFVATDQTPGSLNWMPFCVSLVDLRWEPPSLLAPGHPLTACLSLLNTGLYAIEAATLILEVGPSMTSQFLESWDVDHEKTIAVTILPESAGRQPARLHLRGPAPQDTCSLALGHVQVGPSEVRLSEVMPAPTSGGEWCELVNTGSVPRDLADLALRDEDGTWRRLPARMLEPGDCLLVVQDAVGFRAWLDGLVAAGAVLPCEPLEPVQLAGWPILNNTAPASRDFADRLYLGDAEGTVLDHVTMGLGSGRVPSGRSYERQPDLSWRPSTATIGGTPGCLPPPVAVTAAGDLKLLPNPYSGLEGDGAVRIHLTVPQEASGWTLRVFDLWGRLVRDLGGDDLGPGQRSTTWDARDESGRSLAPGGYVAVLYWRHAGGSLSAATRRLLVIREARP